MSIRVLFSTLGQPVEARQNIWGEGLGRYVSRSWEPQARFPELETLIASFNTTDIVIAGGAVLGSAFALTFGDIDVFPLKQAAVPLARTILANLGYRLVNRDNAFCDNYQHSESHYRPLQLILAHTDCNTANRLLPRFDISACQVAVENKLLVTNEIALFDIQNRQLRVTGSLMVNSLLKRIEKYKERGFRCLDEEQ